jgi:lysophospholipid acyltransferase (LPLAT)-like uncharacterized protein
VGRPRLRGDGTAPAPYWERAASEDPVITERIEHPVSGGRGPRGRISFAAVPSDSTWYRRLSTPLVVLSNLLLAAWIYPCWRTVRVTWIPPLEGLARLGATTGRPLVFYSWHAYEPLTICAFRDVPPDMRPTGIGHDGLLSRMLQQATAWFGYRLWVYRRQSPVRPKQQIIEMVQARGCNIGLFADAGGPYGRVKPGLSEIARETDAWLVPLVVRARPVVMFRWPRRYAFPVPFGSLRAMHGDPLDGRAADPSRCQAALAAVERRAESLDGPVHGT